MLCFAVMCPSEIESTAALLGRVRAGDAEARDSLLARYLPMLRHWAHGRLPMGARDLSDTDDLVQITLVRALKHVATFEPRREGAFLSYLRQILLNAMRDEIRRSVRRGSHEPVDSAIVDPARSPLESAVGADTLTRYEAALARLGEEQREAVVLRVEMNFTYPQVADALGKASANSARMLVTRALLRLAQTMDESRI